MLVLAVVAFWAGVIYPLTATRALRVLALWLPVLAYATIGVWELLSFI